MRIPHSNHLSNHRSSLLVGMSTFHQFGGYCRMKGVSGPLGYLIFWDLFTYLAVPDFGGSMRDRASQPGIAPRHPALGGWNLRHWTPGRFPGYFIFNSTFQVVKGNPLLPSQIILRDENLKREFCFCTIFYTTYGHKVQSLVITVWLINI